MSLNDTLFVGWQRAHQRLPALADVLKQHDSVRDAVARHFHGATTMEPELWPYVATLSFMYAFNSYKAIGLMLPHHYHEAACPVLRQLWEVSLNLHWMEQDGPARAQDFCNFTVIEMRRQIAREVGQQVPANVTLAEYDRATERFQSHFRFVDSKGRNRLYSTFGASNIEVRSKALGDPWQKDYALLYHLASMHAHGAPGAILRPVFLRDAARHKAAENDSAALVAVVSMQLLVRDYRLLVRQKLVADSAAVYAAARFSDDPNDPSTPGAS